MKKTSVRCLVALVSLGSAAWSRAQGTRSTEEAVIRMEGRLIEAQHTCNPDLLAPLLADKIVITASDGKVTNKAEALETCKNTKWDDVRTHDWKLTVFDNAVIVTGDFQGEGTERGKAFGCT